MFDFEPLTEEQLIEEAKLESRYHAWRSKEALSIFVELRKELCNAFVSLDIVVLKPICLNCRYQAIGQEWPDAPHPEIVRIWPELANGRLRLYEAAGQSVEFWPADDGEAEFHSITCYLCAAEINEPGDGTSQFLLCLRLLASTLVCKKKVLSGRAVELLSEGLPKCMAILVFSVNSRSL